MKYQIIQLWKTVMGYDPTAIVDNKYIKNSFNNYRRTLENYYGKKLTDEDVIDLYKKHNRQFIYRK